MSETQVPQISPNIVIMTRDEFNKRIQEAFDRGVKRGQYEAKHPPESDKSNEIDRWNNLPNASNSRWYDN